MKKFLFYLAVTGWVLGLTIHLLTFKDIDAADKIPSIWILHVGIFIVWIPAILELNKNERLRKFKRSGVVNPFVFFKAIFAQTPTWMIIIAVAGFLYTGINFILIMNAQPGLAVVSDGHYILQDHGKIMKTLTEQEYLHYKANELKAFSGHWISFYGFAAAILYPYNKGELSSRGY